MRNWIAVLLFASIPACPCLRAQGEAVAARLTGAILDPQESPVPQARVTLTSVEAALTRQFLSADDGAYIFAAIPPGRYRLRVEKEGFSTSVQEVVLTVGQSTSLNPKLALGAISEVIEVTAGAPLLNSGNPNLGSEVSGKQAEELPLNIRNVYNLVQLSSNANNSTEYQGLT
jgi:hypothetical protein